MSELMKELTYDGKKVVVEVARKDAKGNTIDTTYATNSTVSNKLDTSTFNEYIGTTAPSTYVKIKDFKVNYLDANSVAYKSDVSTVQTNLNSYISSNNTFVQGLETRISNAENTIDDLDEKLTNNYYSKSQTYSKDEVNNIVQQIEIGEWQVVSSLPTTGEEGKVYLVGTAQPYNMYIWESEAWLKIGTTQIDLSGYVPTSRTINGHALTSNVTVTKSDVGLGHIEDAPQSSIYNSKLSSNKIYFTQNGAYALYTDVSDSISTLNDTVDTLNDDIQALSTSKQNKLTAGNGIIIINDVVATILTATNVTIG